MQRYIVYYLKSISIVLTTCLSFHTVSFVYYRQRPATGPGFALVSTILSGCKLAWQNGFCLQLWVCAYSSLKVKTQC